ncbi:ATP-binding protein [Pseudomonas sp. 14P_8.1_Bac3]|uniref:sensor histidine kinase n=1 Tax=Pseudomonas sp. 14P_8.1_Bac3 TaxID=2971621 RepID=UPI0021C8EE6F|nr:ATP-binding protein [Pseudomonas sp. 14P_8.1_Bac3]MCU1758803.1 ATP-binding protein [Pseudomonas sp. 14P_8.1_Bac3]
MPNSSTKRTTSVFRAIRLQPLENLLSGLMGLIVACGIFLGSTYLDYATTPFYIALLLMSVNLLSINGVIAVLLLSMLALAAVFLNQGGFGHWESAVQFLRDLSLLAAIVVLALRSKRIADNLRHKEVYMSGAQRLSQTGCFGFCADLGKIGWSEQSAQIFEYPPSTPPTASMILARTHPEDVPEVLAGFEKAARHEAIIEVSHRLLMPDGRVKHLRMIATPLFNWGRRFEYLGALMDVTAIKQAEAALNQAQVQLAHVTRVTSLGELAASIAHEVNQPLAAITSSGEAGLNWLSRPVPDLFEARKAFERIIASSNRATETTLRVRSLSRKTDPLRRNESFNDIINETLLLVRHELAHHGIRPQIELTAFEVPISADRVQLQQVIINLIINACQAMDDVNASDRKLLIRSWVNDHEVGLEVADKGRGIPVHVLSKLFTPFFTTKETGLGMGLCICRSIIDSHQGRIWASSEEGQGSSFQFALPLLIPYGPGYASAI